LFKTIQEFRCAKQFDVVNFLIPNLGADMQAIKFKTVVTKTGKLKIPPRLVLPEGPVEVIVLNTNGTNAKNILQLPRRRKPLSKEPAWGMWADREEMTDSVAYVNSLRKKLEQRLDRR
jgi:hypothetical protein